MLFGHLSVALCVSEVCPNAVGGDHACPYCHPCSYLHLDTHIHKFSTPSNHKGQVRGLAMTPEGRTVVLGWLRSCQEEWVWWPALCWVRGGAGATGGQRVARPAA